MFGICWRLRLFQSHQPSTFECGFVEGNINFPSPSLTAHASRGEISPRVLTKTSEYGTNLRAWYVWHVRVVKHICLRLTTCSIWPVCVKAFKSTTVSSAATHSSICLHTITRPLQLLRCHIIYCSSTTFDWGLNNRQASEKKRKCWDGDRHKLDKSSHALAGSRYRSLCQQTLCFLHILTLCMK